MASGRVSNTMAANCEVECAASSVAPRCICVGDYKAVLVHRDILEGQAKAAKVEVLLGIIQRILQHLI